MFIDAYTYIWLYRNEQINSYLLNAFAKLILQWGKKERHKAKYEIIQISGLKKNLDLTLMGKYMFVWMCICVHMCVCPMIC